MEHSLGKRAEPAHGLTGSRLTTSRPHNLTTSRAHGAQHAEGGSAAKIGAAISAEVTEPHRLSMLRDAPAQVVAVLGVDEVAVAREGAVADGGGADDAGGVAAAHVCLAVAVGIGVVRAARPQRGTPAGRASTPSRCDWAAPSAHLDSAVRTSPRCCRYGSNPSRRRRCPTASAPPGDRGSDPCAPRWPPASSRRHTEGARSSSHPRSRDRASPASPMTTVRMRTRSRWRRGSASRASAPRSSSTAAGCREARCPSRRAGAASARPRSHRPPSPRWSRSGTGWQTTPRIIRFSPIWSRRRRR